MSLAIASNALALSVFATLLQFAAGADRRPFAEQSISTEGCSRTFIATSLLARPKVASSGGNHIKRFLAHFVSDCADGTTTQIR